jgi:hypothetical protein
MSNFYSIEQLLAVKEKYLLEATLSTYCCFYMLLDDLIFDKMQYAYVLMGHVNRCMNNH